MYKLKTIFGITYNCIHSWKKWDLDEAFIECIWGRQKDKTLILKIQDIQTIEKE